MCFLDGLVLTSLSLYQIHTVPKPDIAWVEQSPISLVYELIDVYLSLPICLLLCLEYTAH